MSIHVTVSGNPVYVGRGKVLLTDIETAKKNEWLRRRKIRLQQARQQGKDLTQSVRKKVSCEESAIEKDEEEKEIEEQNRKREEQISCLQNEYQQSLLSVGTGHHLASIQKECDALVKEKQDLREAIAKARGAIAEERIKAEKCIRKEMSQISVGRKKMVRQIEDLRSAVVSNLPEVKSSVPHVKTSTIKVQVHQSEEPEEESYNKKVFSPTKKFSQCKQREYPRARSSLSPPRSVRMVMSSRERRSKAAEEDSDEDESDDSDVTWPPRSARVTKEPIQPSEPPRVRLYDHNSRIVKDSPRPSYNITKADPFEEPDMYEAIAEEEEAVVRKENLDILARREKMIRGNKALKKERGRREAEKFLKELREMHRKEKIKMAVNRNYPSDLHMRDFRRKEMEVRKQAELHNSIPLPEGIGIKPPMPESTNRNGIKVKSCDQLSGGVKLTRLDSESPPIVNGDNPVPPSKIYQDSSTDHEDFFQELVGKLKAERARQQQELEAKFGVKNIKDADIPEWIRCQQETAGPSGIRMVPTKQDRAVSPVSYEVCKVCSCSPRCTCCCTGNDKSIPKQKDIDLPRNSASPECEHPMNLNKELPKDTAIGIRSSVCGETGDVLTVIDEQPIREQGNVPQDVSVTSDSPRPSSVGAECGVDSSKSSSQSDAVESSLTFEGIKVTVKVSEKPKKKKDKLSGEPSPQTTDKDIQTSLEFGEESHVGGNMTWNNRFSSTDQASSGSTSYMSPPNKLSPAHQTLLRTILGKIEAKNRNPRLHHYIKRVLDMSRKSIDDLPTSSVSDVSISSSIFDKSPGRKPKLMSECHKVCKCNAPCQSRGSLSDDSTAKGALQFSEMAEGYAHRLQDLAKMMERIRILPDGPTGEATDDSSYLSPPSEVHHSVRLSRSVKAGVYPAKPAEESGRGQRLSPSPCQDLPPAHIYPHPSTATHLHPPPSLSSNSRKLAGLGPVEGAPHELSTIQECGESQRPETPQPSGFDPDISSIRGTPHQRGSRDSTGSSLCLLDDKDLSSWLGSSSDDFEEVFKSLGIAWALPTLRKTRQSQRRTSSSQSSSRSRAQYSHSTPLGQSPAKPTGSHQCPTTSTDSDRLTPPSISLNVPQYVWHKHRDSK